MFKAECLTVSEGTVSLQIRDTKTDESMSCTYDELLISMGRGLEVDGVVWT